MTRRELILVTAGDAAKELAYYNRKEDEDLPRGEIQEAIEKGEVTVDEIVEAFRLDFIKWIEWT